MLERKGFMPVNFLQKEKYAGSYAGMRYRMEKVQIGEEKTDVVLRVTHWPEPWCYDATASDLRISMDTTFDEEGIQKGIDWLNEAYEQYKQ